MLLSDLRTGKKAVIVRVNGHGGFRKRLIEMGFINGKEVKIVIFMYTCLMPLMK